MSKDCKHGCGRTGVKYLKSTDDWACGHHSACPAIKQKKERDADFYSERARLSAAAKKKIGDDGLCVYDKALAKMHKTRRLLKETDPEAHDAIAAKMIKTKRAALVDGVTIEQNAILKWRSTMNNTDDLGITKFERAAINRTVHLNTQSTEDPNLTNGQLYIQKAVNSRRNRDKVSGVNSYSIASKKAMITRANDIDQEGLNSFDRAALKGFRSGVRCGKFRDTPIFYQGSFEEDFLTSIWDQHGEEWFLKNVARGPRISYRFINEDFTYLPDYLVNGTLYEVKSQWTWDKRGADLELKARNEAKLNSAAKDYPVKLVLDGNIIEWNPAQPL